MTEIEKIIEQIADQNYKAETRYSDMLSACQQTAAAVIELIRERMPGEAKEYWDGHDIEDKCRRLGWNDCRSEILELLDNIK